MIDYEKLSKAFEILDNLNDQFVTLKIIRSNQDKETYFRLEIDINCDSQDIFMFNSLDEIINKLKELKPKSKYRIGSDVWVVQHMLPTIATVWQVNGDTYHLGLDSGHGHLQEKYIYSTREELIQEQLKHWQSLANEYREDDKPTECEHESDGLIRLTYPPKYKCTKCGEFYQ